MDDTGVDATEQASPPVKACDTCRRRKIRCDKKTPCGNCKKHNVHCNTSPRVQRLKRSQIVTLSQYEGRINVLDKRLERMGSLMGALAADDDTSASASISDHLPSPYPNNRTEAANTASSSNDSHKVDSHESSSRAPPPPLHSLDHQGSPADQDEEGELGTVLEGPSSLSAHSKLAIDFFNKMAVSSTGSGSGELDAADTRELVGALGQIADALQRQQRAPEMAFPTPDATARHREERKMPPIEASVTAIRLAQENRCLILGFFSMLISSPSLSDLCLKVYFSKNYSQAEYIILNVSLFLQLHRLKSHDEYLDICGDNIMSALAGLSLYIRPTFDMISALLLAAVYCIHVSKPLLAWPLIVAAQQASHSLGFHTRQVGVDESSEFPNKSGLVFWVIYFLEKGLALRLGRSSVISHFDITVPMPGGNQFVPELAMAFGRLNIRLARVSSRIYDDLYSAYALTLPETTRKQTAEELRLAIEQILAERKLTQEAILNERTDEEGRAMAEFVYATDEIQCLTMLTLIHRAVPPASSTTSFSDECIAAARASVAAYQAYKPMLPSDKGTMPLTVSTFMSWGILFSPFIPFVVLFCHVIETGNQEDLAQMADFVQSMESLQSISSVAGNHYRLFQVLYSVCRRYTELKTSLTPSQTENMELKMQMDGYLGSLGYQPDLWFSGNNGLGGMNAEPQQHMAPGGMPAMSFNMDGVTGYSEGDLNMSQVNWLSLGEQMMGLLDNDQLNF